MKNAITKFSDKERGQLEYVLHQCREYMKARAIYKQDPETGIWEQNEEDELYADLEAAIDTITRVWRLY